MNIQYYQYMETVYNDSFEQKQNKFSVQQDLSKILDYLQDFDENIKNKIVDKFSTKEKLDMELQYNLNCFNISINIIGLYFQDEAIESQKEIENLINKILQYVEEFHKFIDISSHAKRITEVLLYCLCNVVEKIDLNKVVNYQNEYLEICFINSKGFPLLRLSSAIISSFLNSHNNKIRDDLLKYFDEISNSLMNDKENEFYGIDKKLIGNASKFLQHQNYTFRKDGLIPEDKHTDQTYR